MTTANHHESSENMKDRLLTPTEAISFLGLDRQHLRQPRESLRWLCRTGKLKFTKVGKYVRFRQVWLDDLVTTNQSPRIEDRGLESDHN